MAKNEATDPNVHLPDNIKKQIEAGKQAFEQLTNPSPPEGTPPDPGSEPGTAPAVIVPDDPGHEQSPPAVTEPKDPPPVQLKGEPDPLPTPEQQELARLRQQYNTLQGKYRSETTAANRRVEELTSEIKKLTQQVSDLTTRLLTAPQTTPETKPLTAKRKLASITDDERKEYGDELIDLISKSAQEIADQIVAERLSELQPKFEALSGKVETREQTEHKSKMDNLYKWMDGNIPGWREQDDDPLFVAWLDKDDPFSGVKRMQILANAMHSSDGPRVKMIFEGYGHELAATTARPPAVKPNGSIRAETLAAPNGGRGRTDAIVPTDAPEVSPTPAEIKAYYARKIRNPKSLSEAEVTQMEGRIARALGTGSILAQPRV